MPLASGVRLGPYEVIALLGAGGMGEVYRAKDTRLKRDVAIKVLPEEFSQDPDSDHPRKGAYVANFTALLAELGYSPPEAEEQLNLVAASCDIQTGS